MRCATGNHKTLELEACPRCKRWFCREHTDGHDCNEHDHEVIRQMPRFDMVEYAHNLFLGGKR